MQYCVETHLLRHQFRNQVVVDDLSLQVPNHSIYGFLGPNGAGKTSTLRLLTGLLRKQQGSIQLFGKVLENNRAAILQGTGTLIESPSVYSNLTAAENLKVWQSYFRCPDHRIAQVLQTVGLADTGTKKAGEFSLGMKQRLGIAITLLNQPSLLILDEPTNGLDPEGIIEIRTLLQQLNKEEGITILVSSHLLAEIEKLVSHLGIIHKGKLLFQGPLEDLSQQQFFSRLCIETDDNARAAAILAQSGFNGQLEGDKLILPLPSREQIAQLNFTLIGAGLAVYSLQVNQRDLETIFIDLINQPQ